MASVVLNPISIGIDIGQVSDPSAICVAETSQRDTGRIRYSKEQVPPRYNPRGEWLPAKGAEPVLVTEFTIRHIQRLPLGMSYPEQATHIADILCSPLLRQRQVSVRMDVTGVGRPVYDSLLREFGIRKYGLHRKDGSFQSPREMCEALFFPISFVHGEVYNRRTGSLGKGYLVSVLQTLLQSGCVHAPDTPEMQATLDEMRVYEIKISQNGTDTYGAKTGKHDDLATALGLACLCDPLADKISYSERVY